MLDQRISRKHLSASTSSVSNLTYAKHQGQTNVFCIFYLLQLAWENAERSQIEVAFSVIQIISEEEKIGVHKGDVGWSKKIETDS